MTPEEYTFPTSTVKTGTGQTEPAAASALHVVLLTLVVGFTEIVGFLDIGHDFLCCFLPSYCSSLAA